MKLTNAELRTLWLACFIAEECVLEWIRKTTNETVASNFNDRAIELRNLGYKLEAMLEPPPSE